MNSVRNLQIVSLYFLLVTGLIHFFSGLMYVNDYYERITLIINKVSDLPFLVAGLFYLGVSIKLNIDPEPNKRLDITITAIGVFVFICVLLVNLLLKDKF
ncbi:MAG: hypothetical protein Q8P68_02250 [Candidatus Peregrinibacteria bacterium]|nr:hypothetical protein [Candidatus Peregrinibacteria bacterium]MDZ4245037.1 hypothetical protein [Candidatus Gracilibacteria bacterium]